MVSTLLSTLGAKIATGALIAATVAGGAAAGTGNLPDAAQNAVANVAERISIDLPRAQGHGGTVTDTVFDGDPTDDGRSYGENTADVADQDNRDKGAGIAEDARESADNPWDTYQP